MPSKKAIKQKLKAIQKKKGSIDWNREVNPDLQIKSVKPHKISFKIDANADHTLVGKKRPKLSNDRFVKKPNEYKQSLGQRMRVNKTIQFKAQQKNSQDNIIQANMLNANQQIKFDQWDGSEDSIYLQCKKPKRLTVNMVTSVDLVKQVLRPHGGQSINPLGKDHNALLQMAIDQEIEKDTIKHAVSNKQTRAQKEIEGIGKKRLRPASSKKEKALQDLADERKKEKQKSHQFEIIKQIKKDMLIADQNAEKKRKTLEVSKNEVKKNMLEMGVVPRGQKIGKARYVMRVPEFQMPDDISKNLRNIKAGEHGEELIRTQFDSIFRRGVLPQLGLAKTGGRKKTSLKKYRFHTIHTSDLQDKEELKLIAINE